MDLQIYHIIFERAFLIFTLLTNKIVNPSKIAKKAGINRKTVMYYGKKLQALTNPLTGSPFINYETKFSGRPRIPASRVRKSNISLTGYILSMPVKKRRYLIQEIRKIIDRLLIKYEYPYFIKDFLKKTDQTSRDYNLIAGQLVKLSRIDNKLTYSDCSELFYIMLEVYDFIDTKSQAEIAKEFTRHQSFIARLAKLILSVPEDYKNRFPNVVYTHSKKFYIADGIISGKVTQEDISNIDSFEFQQIIGAYRKFFIELETDKLVQEGYPVIGSQKFKNRIYLLRRKNLFSRYFLGRDFIVWLEVLTELDFQSIIKLTPKANIKRNILLMCNKINQNLEILKFIVYLILKSHDSLRKITTKTGKSFSLVQKIKKSIADCFQTTTSGLNYISLLFF